MGLGFALMAIGLAVALPALVYGERRTRLAQLQGWRAVAATLGLQDVDSDMSLLGNPRLVGRTGGRRVSFGHRARGDKLHVTCVTISGDSGISLRPETGRGRLEEWLDEREIELGDDAFDAEVEVRGPPDRVRAILDAETRTLVRCMLHCRLEVPGGRAVSIHGNVSLEYGDLAAEIIEDPMPPPPEELAEVVGALLTIADRFVRPASVSERLAASIEREPEWRVRQRGLALLATSYPNDRATAAALRRGLADEVPEVRLQAAIAMREGGRATLLEIASSEDVEDATAAHAIDVLGDHFPAEDALGVLRHALRRRRLHTADACIQLLGRLGGTAATTVLCRVLVVETGQLAVAAAQALKKCAGPEAEESLLEALGHGEPDLAVPVLEAFGPLRLGGRRAADPGGRRGRRHRRAARRAPGSGGDPVTAAGGVAGAALAGRRRGRSAEPGGRRPARPGLASRNELNARRRSGGRRALALSRARGARSPTPRA